MWKTRVISTCHLPENKQILDHSQTLKPTLIVIDPLQPADQRRYEKSGYRNAQTWISCSPPLFPAMEKLTLRAIEITKKS